MINHMLGKSDLTDLIVISGDRVKHILSIALCVTQTMVEVYLMRMYQYKGHYLLTW